MGDTRRLLEQGATPFEAQLLQHARSQEPTSHDVERMIAAVGAAGAVALGSTAGSAAVTAKGWTSSLAVIVAKWTGIGVVAGVVTIGAVERAQLGATHALVSAPTPTVAVEKSPAAADKSWTPQTIEAVEDPTLDVDQPLAIGTAPRAAERPVGTNTVLEALPPASPPLSAETALLDGARRALVERDFARAITLLDAYQMRFESGRLAPEAALIRVKVLLERGDRRAAEVAAQSFLDRNPDSFYAKRFRALLATERARPNP